jgi:hypothetical protein
VIGLIFPVSGAPIQKKKGKKSKKQKAITANTNNTNKTNRYTIPTYQNGTTKREILEEHSDRTDLTR